MNVAVIMKEEFDVINLLALLNDVPKDICTPHGGSPKFTKLDVAASLSGLPDHVTRYAYLLAGNLHIERIQDVVYPANDDEFDFTGIQPKKKRKVKEQPIVLNERVVIRDADFFRVRNIVRGFIESALKQDKKKPKSAALDMIAKGIAQCALKMRLYRNDYTLENEIVMCGFTMNKSSYREGWQKYRALATSELMIWEDQIRLKLKNLFKD